MITREPMMGKGSIRVRFEGCCIVQSPFAVSGFPIELIVLCKCNS